MKILPLFIRFKMCHQSAAGGGSWWMPTLWLPILLIWPFVVILALPVFFLGFIAILIFDTRSVNRYMLLWSDLYFTVCAVRGTKVDVEDRENKIFIAID